MKKVEAPTCKKDLQKFLGKVNFLRRFISNLSGKIDAFTPILRLKDETEFTWGAKQQEAFEKIKIYLSSPPILKAPRRGVPFRLYVAAEDKVIGAVLTQETEGKEYIITYLSRRLIDAETRYTFIEKLCLSLYYACTKLRHYLLSSTCIVVCQTDVIKHMLQKPILLGGQNSKKRLRGSRFICLRHPYSKHLGSEYLSDFMWLLKTWLLGLF